MSKYTVTPREALIRARATLVTAASDTPEDLAKPERRRVINLRIEEINEALATMPHDEANHPGQPRKHSNASCVLRVAGKAYPRTCKVCGLGPCTIGAPSDYAPSE